MLDLNTVVLIGYAVMPSAITGPETNSCGTSYCAPSCGPRSHYVAARTSPVYQTPCGEGYGHSTAYNYGVYPVQSYLYKGGRSHGYSSGYNTGK